MDLGEGSSMDIFKPVRKDTIQAGQLVLLRLPRGDVKSIKLDKDSTVTLGKAGSFYANDLIGEKYGLTYEIVGKGLKRLPPKTIQEIDDTDATNELINDGEFVQPVTGEEIEALKQSGVHSSKIIEKQIERHANYSLKTEYSKEKYKKRKEAKFSKSFSTIEPTLFNVCEYWFNKDQNRVRDIRADSLAQIINTASIRPGGKYIVVDEASGIIVAGVLERLGGSGRLFTICDIESPPTFPVVTHMNFEADIITPVLISLSWATAQEEYTPLMSDIPQEHYKTEKQKNRHMKRKAAADSLQAQREELFAGGFDGLIVSSEYDLISILDMLYPYLAGSASIVIHCPFVQVLVDVQQKIRSTGNYLGPSITESWMRRYQVLPGRTHPIMSMSGSGGFILHAYKVFDNPDVQGVIPHRQQKKQKPKPDIAVVESVAPMEDASVSETSLFEETRGEPPG